MTPQKIYAKQFYKTMSHIEIHYSIIQFQPHSDKREVINIGIAFFTPEKATLEFLENMEKIHALDPNILPADVQNHIEKVKAGTQLLLDAHVSCHDIAIFFSRTKVGIRFTPTTPLVISKSPEEVLDELMRYFVLPPEKILLRSPNESLKT